MSALRIFSYLPNPRIWKARIAARLCGIDDVIRLEACSPNARPNLLGKTHQRHKCGSTPISSLTMREFRARSS